MAMMYRRCLFVLGCLIVVGCVEDTTDSNTETTDAAPPPMVDTGGGRGCEGSGPPIEPETLSNGVVGIEYSQDLEVIGGSQEGVAWSIASGALPDGLTLDTMTGTITGTPTVAGEFSFAIDATVPTTGQCVIQPGYADLTITIAAAGQTGEWSCVQRNNQGSMFACSDYPDADEETANAHCETRMTESGVLTSELMEGGCPLENQQSRCTYDYMGTTVIWIMYSEEGSEIHVRWESSCAHLDGEYERL